MYLNNLKYYFLKKTLFLSILLFFQSCQINPATGEKEVSLMSTEEEDSIGRREHKKLISQFGGIYREKELQNYINSIGNFLVSTSELPNKKFTFTILDSEIINAFALPGGYVYLTRGLIALCNNEAQLAGVLAHEIGHVTGRHAAQRYTRTIGTNLVTNILSVLINNPSLGNLVGQGAGLYVLSYSRSQEIEADKLAVRYMSRAGFAEEEMANFLRSMERYTVLSKKMQNKDTNNTSDLLSTHPSSSKRVRQVISESKLINNARPIYGKEIFLKKINGMRFGQSPKEGVIFGDHFIHNGLEIKFKLPEDFFFLNTAKFLLGTGEDDSKIIIDVKKNKNNEDILEYTKRVLGKKFPKNYNRNSIDGMDSIDIVFKQKDKINRLAVIRNGQNILRFLLTSKKDNYSKNDNSFQTIFSSVQKLTKEELDQPKKKVLKIYTVKPKDTFEKIVSKQNVQKKFAREIFMIINNKQKENLRVGEKIKVISFEN